MSRDVFISVNSDTYFKFGALEPAWVRPEERSDMTANDILARIASALSERKSSAALSNYEVLANNVKYVNDLLKATLHRLSGIQAAVDAALADSANRAPDFVDGTELAPFARIVPRVMANGLSVLEKFTLHTEPDDRSGISIESVSLLHRGFLEYSAVATATRQVVDSMISDAYQLQLLEPKSLNHHVLVSLNSFDRYVTPSIRHALFSDDLVEALSEFRKLSFKQWNDSPITQCRHSTFAQKVDFLFEELGISHEADFAETLKDVFKFTSEFTHIGYVSTFFTSTSGAEVIFGDNTGPYLPSTENFCELKYQLLETVSKLVASVYLPAVGRAWHKLLREQVATPFIGAVSSLATEMRDHLKTRNSQYYFFIKDGLPASDRTVELKCQCGTLALWTPPHDSSALYCRGCGSHFKLLEIEGDAGYVITSAGPVRIIGSDAPEFKDLPQEEQLRMMREVERLMKEKAS